LIEHSLELVGRQRRIGAIQYSHSVQMRKVADEPLCLWIHDSRKFLGNPRELTAVSHHHAEKPQDHPPGGHRARHVKQVPDIWYQVRKKVHDIQGTLPSGSSAVRRE